MKQALGGLEIYTRDVSSNMQTVLQTLKRVAAAASAPTRV